jgi:7-cyano-7-deazaguanine tRNA-ribosyltransferase
VELDALAGATGIVNDFEILERDGLARIGRFPTPHGEVRTPALLPVVHPDRRRQAVPARALRDEFGFPAIITSSYITWRDPALRERAESEGVHALVDFDGPIMTDSGAFQQHAYGSIEVGADEIVAFQGRIGSDIATVLDIFTEPGCTLETAEAAVRTTSERARSARTHRAGLLAVPVQGGRFPELRSESARSASEIGDVLAIGGVVPLLEQYRFAELAEDVLAARTGVAPEHPVHLFGTGHPIVFAFAALLGVDIFDSSSYHKFARRGALLFASGTVSLESVREPICDCRLCAIRPLHTVIELPPSEREAHLARHNLLMCATELSRVRQAIRDGTLWELAERRAGAHPALVAGLKSAVRGARLFAPAEPASRSSYRATSTISTLRPAAIRFLAQLRRYRSLRGTYRLRERVGLTVGALRHVPAESDDGQPLLWECPTPIGPVPLELSEIYPIGCWVGAEDFEPRRSPPDSPEAVDPANAVEPARDWSEAWTQRQIQAVLEWYFGPETASLASKASGERSRMTGRLRRILGPAGEEWFMIGPGAIPRPTWLGGQALHAALPYPRARIVVDRDAIPFVREGRSLFSRFVRGGDSSLYPESPALLVDEQDELLAVGRLLLAPYEMGRFRRGVAVRVTSHLRAPSVPDEREGGAASVGAPSAPEPDEL